jgi:hypothetical protein
LTTIPLLPPLGEIELFQSKLNLVVTKKLTVKEYVSSEQEKDKIFL